MRAADFRKARLADTGEQISGSDQIGERHRGRAARPPPPHDFASHQDASSLSPESSV